MVDVITQHGDGAMVLRHPAPLARTAPAPAGRARWTTGPRRPRRSAASPGADQHVDGGLGSARGRGCGRAASGSRSASSGQRTAASAASTTSAIGDRRGAARAAPRSMPSSGSHSRSISAARTRSPVTVGAAPAGRCRPPPWPRRRRIVHAGQGEGDRDPHLLGRIVGDGRHDRGRRTARRRRRARARSRPARPVTGQPVPPGRPRPPGAAPAGAAGRGRPCGRSRGRRRPAARAGACRAGCWATARMSSPRRTSRSSSLSTSRSITTRLLSSSTVSVGGVERATAQAGQQVRAVARDTAPCATTTHATHDQRR